MSGPNDFWSKDVKAANAASPAAISKEKKLDVDVRGGEQTIVKSKADIENDRNRIALERERFIAELASKGLMLDAKGRVVPRPGGILRPEGPRVLSDAEITAANKAGDFEAAVQSINLLTNGFNNNLKGRGLVRSTLEYFPSQAKGAINATSAGLSDVSLALFKVPGMGSQSDSDAARFVAANQPSTWDKDFAYLGKLYNLRRRLDAKAEALGLPKIKWVEPADIAARQFFELPKETQAKIGNYGAPAEAAAPPAEGKPSDMYPPEASALNQAMAVTAPLVAASSDATTVSKPIPPEMQQEMQDWLGAHPRGTVKPEDYAAFRNALDAKHGFSGSAHSASDPALKEFVNSYNGKGGLNTAIPPAVKPDTRNKFERVGGGALMSPVGTAVTTALAGTSLNLADMLLPEQMQGLRELNPNAALVGDVAGSLAGTSLLGKTGAKLSEKLLSQRAPELYSKLMSGGRGATFARNTLADVGQGSIYGGAVEGDAIGGGESALTGDLIFGSLGKLARGFSRTPEAERLAKLYGVRDLTVGQQLGGVAKSVEDAATSLPIAGDVINARRGESLLSANDAAFRQVAGAPVGRGEAALEDVALRRGKAYTDALQGREFDLNNPNFEQEMRDALLARAKLTEEFQPKFDKAVTNSLEGTPIGDTGLMTGPQYQQSQRKLTGYKPPRGTGFEQDFRDALSGVSTVLRNQVERDAPEVIPALSAADTMYRGEKILQDAVKRARKDVTGLGGDVFTPGHLTDAVAESGRKYPGLVPLKDFAADMQHVLPSKMPDSGTARRMALGAATVGGIGAIAGGGASAAGGGDLADIAVSGGESAAVPIATLAALALGGSKKGQRALSKLLFERYAPVKLAGKYLPKVSPAVTPLLLQNMKADNLSEAGWYDPKTNTVVMPDGTVVDAEGNPVKKARGGRVKAKNRAELFARYAGGK